jgi:hypothetical protein
MKMNTCIKCVIYICILLFSTLLFFNFYIINRDNICTTDLNKNDTNCCDNQRAYVISYIVYDSFTILTLIITLTHNSSQTETLNLLWMIEHGFTIILGMISVFIVIYHCNVSNYFDTVLTIDYTLSLILMIATIIYLLLIVLFAGVRV